MDILTHQGPGYRSRLIPLDQAQELHAQLSADPQWSEVRILQSTRAQHRTNRYYVLCQPDSEEKRQEFLARHQQERIQRAQQEGPEYVRLAGDPRPPRLVPPHPLGRGVPGGCGSPLLHLPGCRSLPG